MPPKITSKINIGDASMAPVPKAQKLARPKYSNFLLTINTNQPVQPTSAEFEPFRKRFRGVIGQILGGDNILKYITYKESGGSADKIVAINCESTIEVGGGANKSVHCHSVVQIKHNTLLHLDQMKIRHVVQRAMGLTKVHLNIKVLPRNAQMNLENALRYIRKDVTAADTADTADTTDATAEYV